MENIEMLVSKDKMLKKLYNNCPREIKEKQILKKFPVDYTIIKKGEIVDSVYILVAGKFDVFKDDDKSNRYSYLSNKAPCFAGILEVLSGGHVANATVRTGDECLVIIVDAISFKNWIESDFETYKLVFENFTRDMYHTLNEVDPSSKPHGKNLIMRHLSMYYREEILDNGFTTIVIEESFAHKLNMENKNLQSYLEMLRDDQLIDYDGNKLSINEQQLGRIENFLLHNFQTMY
ncbi:MAG: cyclic nucleotide-binding domain-containing protein [Sphaerochaeta sp.]